MTCLMEAASVDEDAQTLEEALAFLESYEASPEWLLGFDDDAQPMDLSRDSIGELPTLTELPMDLPILAELPTLTEHFTATELLSPAEPFRASPPSSPPSSNASPSLSDAGTSASDAAPTTLALVSDGRRTQESTKPKAKTKKPRKYSNRARDARREELVYLRQKVKDMEAQLEIMRTRPSATGSASATFSSVAAPPSMTLDQHSNAELASTASPSHLAAVWGDMAQRQAQERQKAERENVRLKLVLERQIKMAKSLERILKKRNHDKEALGGPGKRIRRVSPAADANAARDDRADFDMLLAGIEQSRQEVDAVFEANGLGQMETAHRTAKIEHDAAQGMVMEIYANKVMPFDMPTTGKAVWRHFAHSMDHMPHRTYYEKQPLHIEASDNTVVERYGLEMTDGHTKGDFHVKHIIRRYVEPDRLIVVWRTLTDTVEFSAEPTPGIRFLEKGYIVIKPPAVNSQDCTLMQTCYIIRPDVYSHDDPDQARKVGALTDFVLSSVSGSISASHQMIENVLLSGALKK